VRSKSFKEDEKAGLWGPDRCLYSDFDGSTVPRSPQRMPWLSVYFRSLGTRRQGYSRARRARLAFSSVTLSAPLALCAKCRVPGVWKASKARYKDSGASAEIYPYTAVIFVRNSY
jgi:hypothetical protein